jgi:multicomponent Na+:H+ antiporter subunit F
MTGFLIGAAGFVMLTVVVGLLRILYGPGDADRIMAAQLLGSGGIATLLLSSAAREVPGLTDAALILAVLAAFATIAFVKDATATQEDARAAGRDDA